MSRIEQALEKAAHLRNTTGGSAVKTKEAGNTSIQAIRQHTLPPLMDGAELKSRIENPLLATLCDPHSIVSEEYRKLKSVVTAFAQQGQFKNVIMVTSSVSGEGKSITSLNLAITLAQEFDHTVLLIDADLRKPSLQEYLGMKPGKGLSDYLNGEAVLGDLLINSGIGRLTLLPAGTPVRNPVELFSSQKLRDFIVEIKNRYSDRFIIIDTPPLLPFAETRTLGALVDGVLFVIREGVVTPANIQESMKTLDSTKLIGTVFNEATQASLNGHYHYYGYGYSKQGTAGRGQGTVKP
jgi:protein-tyrosine kinase